MARLLSGFGYTKRPVPTDAAGLPPWLPTEFGNIQRQIAGASTRTITASTTVELSDGLILCDTTGGAINVTWPATISATKDWLVTIKRISAGGFNVTLVGTFDGAVNPTLAAQYASKTIWSDGTSLHVIATV